MSPIFDLAFMVGIEHLKHYQSIITCETRKTFLNLALIHAWGVFVQLILFLQIERGNMIPLRTAKRKSMGRHPL
jgi:hypothetical protein